MKLHFKTLIPGILKEEIFDFVEAGNAKTWEIVKIGGESYLSHTGQWKLKGVLKIVADDYKDHIIVDIWKLKSSDQELVEFQGIYLGRFCELMFNNFWDEFTSIEKEG